MRTMKCKLSWTGLIQANWSTTADSSVTSMWEVWCVR